MSPVTSNRSGSETGQTPATRWWVKPALLSLPSLLAVLLIASLTGWSLPIVVVLIVGVACGIWWFVAQRPNGQPSGRDHGDGPHGRARKPTVW
jgi:Flp pilus assembly protein TadB